MHHIYHTDSIILESRPLGDGNKLITLFTRELGLIKATAQSIRKIHSKLRYALQDYSIARTDLVHGRELWRITSASPIAPLFDPETNKYQKEAYINVAKLASKLLPPELPIPQLYDDMVLYFDAIGGVADREPVRNMEVLIVIRLLVALGYLPHDIGFAPLLEGSFTALEQLPVDRLLLVSAINQALHDSHLV